MVGIYKITSPSNKVYIGQSWDINNRFKSHIKDSRRDRFRHYPICNSIRKYGWDSHVVEVIHVLPVDISQEYLDEYEVFCINQFKEIGADLLNVTKGGSRGKHSEETKKKIGELSKKKVFTDEYRAKLRKRIPNKTMLGKKHTESAKSKMSEIRKGRKFTDSHKKSLSESLIKVVKKSDKPIINQETGEIFKCIAVLSRKINVNKHTLRYRLNRGKQPPYTYQPSNVRKIILASNGALSTNEA